MLPEPFFSGPGIDRADQVRVDEARLAEIATRDDGLQLQWRDGLPAVGADGRLEWLPAASSDLFLGLQDGAPRFSATEQPHANARAAFDTIGLLREDEAPLFAAALSLAWWHSRHQFCANCGAATEIERGGWSRKCPECSAQHFPRVDPVVIMLAEHEGRLLLGRQPQYPPGRYSALAGFLEPGESIEAAVARELHEEAGIAVRDVTYVASQPWPFPGSLMIACIADAAAPEIVLDTNELEDAAWFDRAAVSAALAGERDAPFQAPPHFAIANTLLKAWRDGG